VRISSALSAFCGIFILFSFCPLRGVSYLFYYSKMLAYYPYQGNSLETCNVLSNDLKMAFKTADKKTTDFELETRDGKVSIDNKAMPFEVKPSEVKFPPYKQVIPELSDEEKAEYTTIAFSLPILEKLVKLTKAFAGKEGIISLDIKDGKSHANFRVYQSGNSDDKIKGLVMPISEK